MLHLSEQWSPKCTGPNKGQQVKTCEQAESDRGIRDSWRHAEQPGEPHEETYDEAQGTKQPSQTVYGRNHWHLCSYGKF